MKPLPAHVIGFSILFVLLVRFVAPATTAAATAPLPDGTSDLFAGSGVCAMCHRSNGVALSEKGADVSPVTLWRAGMMAHAARDPLWRAVVASETAEFPGQQALIEDTCTRCHAPLGHAEAHHDGTAAYAIAAMAEDPLALDGVSCTLCHQIQPGNLGQTDSFSGGYRIGTGRHIYGPYPDPFPMPMRNHTGYTPVHGAHVQQSELCGTCHTLYTPVLNDAGEATGRFAEQTTYLEWKHSQYARQRVTCQGCHMPYTSTGVDIATLPPWHDRHRVPFWYHYLTGGNEYMLRLLQANRHRLGLTAGDDEFAFSAAKTGDMLRRETARLTVAAAWQDDGLQVDVRVTNLTGHKLPTGIPLRRMWLHLTVTDARDAVVFESGAWTADGEILGEDRPFEPHHQRLTRADQVQIYETVLGDSRGRVTETLLRTAGFLKDNRLLPRGLTLTAAEEGDLRPRGVGDDPDFTAGPEHPGCDTVTYALALPAGTYRVRAELCYQLFRPALTAHLAHFDTPETRRWQELSAARPPVPVILQSVSCDVGAASGL